MATVSAWSANELENLFLDEINLSDERGRRVAKIMAAVKEKADALDAQIDAVDARIDAWDPGVVWNWKKTLKAASVQFVPVPESDLEPYVDFMFAETPPAGGEKGPDNPSTVTGVTSVTVTHCETEGVDSTDYTIQLGDTYYGGTLDVAAGEMTVAVGATVLDEDYNFGSTSGYLTEYNDFYAIVFYPGCGPYSTGYIIPATFTSNRLPIEFKEGQSAPTQNSILLRTASRGVQLCISKSDLSLGDGKTITDVRPAMLQWLSTHPVTVTCPLENATTVQLTPTQIKSLPALDKYIPRINTVYTDQVSVQVGFQRVFDEKLLADLEARVEALEGE